MATSIAKFELGQKVRYPGFTNCFGEPVKAVEDLTVVDMKLIEPDPLSAKHGAKPYFRIKAMTASGGIEGPERFFEKV